MKFVNQSSYFPTLVGSLLIGQILSLVHDARVSRVQVRLRAEGCFPNVCDSAATRAVHKQLVINQ